MAEETIKYCGCRYCRRSGVPKPIKDVGHRYAVGHNPNSHKHYATMGAKIAAALTGRKLPQEVKDKLSVAVKTSAKFAAAMEKHVVGSVWHKNLCAAVKKCRGVPKKFKDPEGRAAKIAATHNTPEHKRGKAQRTSDSWKDPEVRRARCQNISKAWETVEKTPPTKEHKAAIGKGVRRAYREGRHPGGGYHPWYARRYKGKMFRSSYEVALVQWFERNQVDYLYEPKTFSLGATSWRPDFYVPSANVWIETKGLADVRFWRKVVLFHKLYPTERLLILDYWALVKYGVLNG